MYICVTMDVVCLGTYLVVMVPYLCEIGCGVIYGCGVSGYIFSCHGTIFM